MNYYEQINYKVSQNTIRISKRHDYACILQITQFQINLIDSYSKAKGLRKILLYNP